MMDKQKLPRFWGNLAGIVWGGALLVTLVRGVQGVVTNGLPWGLMSQYALTAIVGALAVTTVLLGKRDRLMGVAFGLCALLQLVVNPFVVMPLLERLVHISYSTVITLPQILLGCLYILAAVDCFVPRLPKVLRLLFLVLPVAAMVGSVVVDLAFVAGHFPKIWMSMGARYLAGVALKALLDGIPGLLLGVAFFRTRD